MGNISLSDGYGLEGSGNNSLLNYLKEAEKKSSKTSIDISRSIFVINKADSVTAEARTILQQEEIKNKEDEEFSIKLANKKLFFTSASYAYVAKASKNGVATPEEANQFKAGEFLLTNDLSPLGHCYRQDRCATSEIATKAMLQYCEAALHEAEKIHDDCEKMIVCSGLYALEKEIQIYGKNMHQLLKLLQ